MTRHLVILSLTISFSIPGFAQSNPAEVKMEKVNALLKKNKIDEAEEKLEKLLDEFPSYGDGWDLLGDIQHYHFRKAKENPGIMGQISVTTKDENGNEVPVENDTLAQKFMALLNKFNPSETAYDKYLYTLRKATLLSNSAVRSSIGIRNALRVPKVDTLVSTKALKFYNQAEEQFGAKNYNKAAKLYQRAIDEQPDFYKAQLYLADSYYFLGYYLDAIKYFGQCAERNPWALEPRKYLIDAYGKEGLYDKSLESAIESMLIYPDLSNVMKMDDAAFITHKKMAVTWMPRAVFPIKIDDDAVVNLNRYVSPDTTHPGGIWTYYTDALDKLEKYCDNKGVVIQQNELTKSKYLEVFAWEEMLKNSDDEFLEQAKSMQERGYLDCYALITCFHDDFYDQYKHFVTHNREKVLDYFNDVVIVSK